MEVSTYNTTTFILPITKESNHICNSLISTTISFIDNRDKINKSSITSCDIFIREKLSAMEEPDFEDLITSPENINGNYTPYHTFKIQKDSVLSFFVLE